MRGTIGRGLFGLFLLGFATLGHYLEGPNCYSLFYSVCGGLVMATVWMDLADRRRSR
jgi:hypothetical protein